MTSTKEKKQIAVLTEMARDMDDISKLHPWLREYLQPPTEWCRFPIRHPWVYSTFGPILPHELNNLLKLKFEDIKEAMREKQWDTFLWLHERPYRMHALEKLYFTGRISHAEMAKLLLMFWTDTEIPEGNQQEPLYLFRQARWVTDDQKGFDALPKRLTLYRGVDGVCELTSDGPSWTLNRRVADFFAKRYAKGKTYRIILHKDNPGILAYITGRDEAEFILDFEQLNSDKIKCIEDFSEEGD
jgi:hypothetical protein